ncbi:unnamed protein product [Paramecium sonneborni]|uniref:Uncharacterized protein n=1 Tax=Paramecium sonneborni TaxID=65129 RepID=A0A8S1KMP3_9CILI|nr:unnamed protein product [Paramecium sonneborni]
MNSLQLSLLGGKHNLRLKQIEMLPKNPINEMLKNNFLLQSLMSESLLQTMIGCKRNLKLLLQQRKQI